MASYHFGPDGKPVKCNTADPNGVCRIHGNMDIQANSAEEAQHKYNAMKLDEANAEDIHDGSFEDAKEAWEVYYAAVKTNCINQTTIGPKTIDAIAHKPGVWESLNDDEKKIMINHYTVDNGNGYKEITDNAPDGVLESYGYSRVFDVISKANDYLGYPNDDLELQHDADCLINECSHADDGLDIRGGVAIPSVFECENDDAEDVDYADVDYDKVDYDKVFVNYPVDLRIYESMWNTYVEDSLNAGYEVSDDDYDDYRNAMLVK